jgi:Concanavalin A-like lectin/glucanases superfamily
MKKRFLLFIFLVLVSLLLPTKQALAMPVGTLLYRTSGDDKMYGYNANDLILAEKGKLAHIYSGHTAIYIGKENGTDYIVEMQPKGAIKVPAKYFINESLGEKLVGAKIPEQATPNQIAKAVAIAKNLADKNLAYDFDFKYQKGPFSNQWTCVGLTEKIYESANISNPANLGSLVYNPNDYAVDITRDGYDNSSVCNASGDCFSSDLEYSKIERKNNMLIPAPEIIGFDIGLERDGERFIFLPYTQYLQSTLKDVSVDIKLSSSFTEPEVRGDSPILGLVLKWSLINNPISTIKTITSKTTGLLLAIKDKIFPDSSAVLAEDSGSYDFSASVATSTKIASVKASSTKTSSIKAMIGSKTTVAKTSSASNSGFKIAVIKATSTKGISVGATTSKTFSVSLTTPKNTTTAELNTAKTTSVKLSTTKATATPILTTPKIIAITRTTPRPIIPIASSVPVVVATSTGTTTEITTENTTETKPVALIAKIYSNGDDDWLEIINATDQDFDLATAGYRLEKAKAGTDPTLIMRFGDEADGTYPGGTIIAAHGYYLIARNTASAEILAQADAIATKSTFSWTEDGYTLYLGTASISSDEDPDVVDKLGYGDATYYESAPAEALKKGYALERKASAVSTLESMASGGLEELWPRLFDSNDNSSDFILVPYDLDLIASENISTSTEENRANPNGLNSENMTHLWHFDECYGETAANELQFSGESPVDLKKSDKWLVGLWGCANVLTDLASSTKATFNSPLDPNQLTINFYYRNTQSNFSIILKLTNSSSSSQQAYMEITPYYTTLYGFPGPEGRINSLAWPNDSLWHQFSLVINREAKYFSLYLDGKEVYSYEYTGIMPTFSGFELSSAQNELVALDELSFWNRSLPATELRSINLLNQPFNPYTWPEAQQPVKLEHYWNFDENTGLTAKDSAGTDNFAVKLAQWDMEGRNDSALSVGESINTTLNSLPVTDLSLSFWWRNTSSPNEGRLHLMLKNGTRNLMSLTPTIYNSTFGFNSDGGYLWEYGKYLFPDDNKWHHLALVYDSYKYVLRFYLDGQQRMERQLVKLREGEKINGLEIFQENWTSSIDELKIWSGSLTTSQVLAEYEAFK